MEEGASAHRHGSVISSRPLPIDVKREPPWNRWFFKTVHYWRYGYSHPDEDLLGVIDAVGDALNVHIMSARAELSGAKAARADQIKALLDKELKKTIPDFSTLLGIESMINALYPPAMARRRQWLIRERFERVAPPGAFQSWRVAQMTSQLAPPEPPVEEHPSEPQPEPLAAGEVIASEGDRGAAGEEAVSPAEGDGDAGVDAGGAGGGDGADERGGGDGGEPPEPPEPHEPAVPPMLSAEMDDTQTLLGYIHSNYLLSIAREKAVRDLKRWLLMRFWFFLLFSIPTLAIGGLVLLWLEAERYWGLLLGLFLVVIAGRIGATTSVIRRMQTAISGNVLARDPILELTALRTGKNEISLALLTSSIFALLLYAFFLSGVPAMMGFSQGIFPEPAREVPGIVEREQRGQEATPAAEEETEPVANAELTEENEIAAAEEGGEAAEAGAANETAAAPADGNLAAANGNLAAAETNQAGTAEETAAADGNVSATADAAKRERKLDLSCQPGVDCDPFDDLARRLGLEGAVDFFKLLLWAFIAGFAERFVPDVLDRVVARGRPRSNEDTEAVLAAHASVRNASGPRDPTAVVQSVTTVRNPPDSG